MGCIPVSHETAVPCWKRVAHVRSSTGTPQGGVISPLLANVYLHEVLDLWFESVVKPRLSSKASLFRYADDFVLIFHLESDARRVLDVLPKRFGKYGLALHPDKTRLAYFRRPQRDPGPVRKPETFDFLGFTYFWAKSRRGKWMVRRTTASNNFSRALKRVRLWCKKHRHAPVRIQHLHISRMLHGHYAYFGITGNADALRRFRWEVGRVWRYWLDRRSQRAKMKWDRFNKLLERYPLPPARVVHSIYRDAAKP